MSLRNLMLEDLERGLAIFRAGHEVVPSWRILSPEGDSWLARSIPTNLINASRCWLWFPA